MVAKSESPVDRWYSKHPIIFSFSTCFNHPFGGAGFRLTIHTRWCPSSLAKLVQITPISLWFMEEKTIINGVYKPTNITFGGTILQYHIISSGFPSATIAGKMESIDPHLKGDPKGRS